MVGDSTLAMDRQCPRHATSTLKDQTAKALAAWLNVDEGREVALFNAMLAEDDPTSGPWLVTNRYIWTTR